MPAGTTTARDRSTALGDATAAGCGSGRVRPAGRGLAAHGGVDASNAARRAAEIFLQRRLFKRRRDGQVIHRDVTRLHYPRYWHYDILGGLRGIADVGLIHDDRCTDALDLLESKRLPDGGWPAEARFYRVSSEIALHNDYVDWGGTSTKRRNDWVTADGRRAWRPGRGRPPIPLSSRFGPRHIGKEIFMSDHSYPVRRSRGFLAPVLGGVALIAALVAAIFFRSELWQAVQWVGDRFGTWLTDWVPNHLGETSAIVGFGVVAFLLNWVAHIRGRLRAWIFAIVVEIGLWLLFWYGLGIPSLNELFGLNIPRLSPTAILLSGGVVIALTSLVFWFIESREEWRKYRRRHHVDDDD